MFTNNSFMTTILITTTTTTTTITTTSRNLSSQQQKLQTIPRVGLLTIIVAFFVVGVIGNFLALVILARKRATKNSKYTFMLRCLATNNLIGLMGMLTRLILHINMPSILRSHMRWDCASMVVWRFFGLSSGCIAAVMAIERWMALARPFTYHKHITYTIVRKTINSLISIATLITFLPFIGYGVYYDEENQKCMRYRDATTLWDKSYAVLFMIFGTLLCTVIVVCNLFVTRVLCFIGRSKTPSRNLHYDLVNREKIRPDGDSNTSASSSGSVLYQHSNGGSIQMPNTSSPDEIKFAKLMAFLSISFVICWMPQMISIPLALMPNRLPPNHGFFRLADLLMALHFTSDPYVYVLSRTKHSFVLGCIKRWRSGFKRTQSDRSRLRPTMEQHTTEYGLNA